MNPSLSQKSKVAVLWTVVSLMLAACGTTHVSRDISPQGVAGEVVFPSLGEIVLKEGTFPGVENLRNVGPGATKDQLYHLLGRPHFREGYAGVREWDYLFHFRVDSQVVTCQYKAIFDKEYRAQSFHWLPESCAEVVSHEPVVGLGEGSGYNLSSDALFAFAKYEHGDILPEGRQALSVIAETLKGAEAALVTVSGHTDRLGDTAENQLLSQRRAQAVRQYLVDQGVSVSRIHAEGWGESVPVKNCTDGISRVALIDCLQPNRRVEIKVNAVLFK